MELAMADVNGDGQPDLITSGGEIFYRQPGGGFPAKASLTLPVPAPSWVFLGVGDFNGDGQPDLAFMAADGGGLTIDVYYHQAGETPYPAQPSAVLKLPKASVSRDGPTVGDWNGDGIDDLMVGSETGPLVLLGAKEGLRADHSISVPLDYRPWYDARLALVDLQGDGKMDLAGWGYTAPGAPGIYVRRHD
jgi:hypothetical protein